MKVLLGLLLVFIILWAYAWWGIVKPEQQQAQQQASLFPESSLDSLQSLSLTTGEGDVHIEKRDGIWWVTQPHEYLANQEFIEKSLRIMQDTPTNHQFPLEQDNYGLQPGKAFFRLQFFEGQEKRLKVGEKEGPGETIYILDIDANEVFVVHNVWAQLLYFPTSRFYHPGLPIPGTVVKDIALFQGEEEQWSVTPAGQDQIRFVEHGQEVLKNKAHALWLFKKVREFPLENLEFGEPHHFKTHWQLKLTTDKGNITFNFDESMEKIRVESFNIFAQVNPYSLKSLGYEINKVIKSDKK